MKYKELIFRLTLRTIIFIVLPFFLIYRILKVHAIKNIYFEHTMIFIILVISFTFYLSLHKELIVMVRRTWYENIIIKNEWKNHNYLISTKKLYKILSYWTNALAFIYFFIFIGTFIRGEKELILSIVLTTFGSLMGMAGIHTLFEKSLEKKIISAARTIYNDSFWGKYYELDSWLREKEQFTSKLQEVLSKRYKTLTAISKNISSNEISETERKISEIRMYMEEIKLFSQRFNDTDENFIMREIRDKLTIFYKKEVENRNDSELIEIFKENHALPESEHDRFKYHCLHSKPQNWYENFPNNFYDFHPRCFDKQTLTKISNLNSRMKFNKYYDLDTKLVKDIEKL